MNVSLSFASPARKQNTTTTTNRGNPMTTEPKSLDDFHWDDKVGKAQKKPIFCLTFIAFPI